MPHFYPNNGTSKKTTQKYLQIIINSLQDYTGNYSEISKNGNEVISKFLDYLFNNTGDLSTFCIPSSMIHESVFYANYDYHHRSEINDSRVEIR